jgi:hypothetical protein
LDTLEYPALNNIDDEAGSLAFWFYPNGWHGGDSVRHKLFSLQGHPDQLICIDKSAANNLEFYYMPITGIPYLLQYAVDSSKIPVNTWAHIYITWDDDGITTMWLNNLSVGSLVSNPGYYGTWHEGIYQADAYFDSFFICEKALNASDRLRIYRSLHKLSFNELTRRGWW